MRSGKKSDFEIRKIHNFKGLREKPRSQRNFRAAPMEFLSNKQTSVKKNPNYKVDNTKANFNAKHLLLFYTQIINQLNKDFSPFVIEICYSCKPMQMC